MPTLNLQSRYSSLEDSFNLFTTLIIFILSHSTFNLLTTLHIFTLLHSTFTLCRVYSLQASCCPPPPSFVDCTFKRPFLYPICFFFPYRKKRMPECPEVGDQEGTNEGASDGAVDGTEEGASEGINDGSYDGLDDGISEGESDGASEGPSVSS
jgi:hypothetical protein